MLERIADQILPELETGEFAFVIGMAVRPINRFELIVRKAGEAEHGVMRFGARLTGENHSIVEDDCAQSQCSSSKMRRVS